DPRRGRGAAPGPGRRSARSGRGVRDGDRGVLVVGSDGLPVEFVHRQRTYRYADWTEDQGRRVPTRVERVGTPAVVYRWSDFDWNAPAPRGL
ncbi:MAG: hypothetical protein AAFZ65_16900, partial [Planctomycetota bacterium]